MYIAIDMEVFKINPIRALKFAIRRETLLDILLDVEREKNSEKYKIYYVK